MIQERRAIIFPRADFLNAVRRYAERSGKPIPDTPPENLIFDPTQDSTLIITFPAVRGGVPVRHAFSRDDIEHALCNYCRDLKIPLPNVSKQVEKYKDGAVLTMHVGDHGLHVMIIDDVEMMRSIIKKLMARANPARIIEASNGAEALEMLRNGDAEPDVIICDLHMNTMDGMQFLKELRADRSNINNRKPVLILTGDKNEQAHELTRQMGASKVLTKPITGEELVRQINLVRGYFEMNK
jgi:two-component system, chemotaxis family, chemotaxis protein CheY